ncbi:endopeptidase La [Treponema primitia]|uniref:endopeptidase La n=1 Tax=Treponema primitia TaxID=88058 RepID=UPI000317A00E|nr:endopeptidase La [Treponema primitia]
MKFLSPMKGKNTLEDFPLLPLRELVLFPHTVIPIFITYKSGITALEDALKRDSRLFAACLKESPSPAAVKAKETAKGKAKSKDTAGGAPSNYPLGFDGETYAAGTVVKVLQHMKLPDNTFRVVLQGEYRGIIAATQKKGSFSTVSIEPMVSPETQESDDSQAQALIRAVQRSFAQYAEYSKKISTETILSVEKSESPERVGNLICNALGIKPDRKVALLQIPGTEERMEAILEALETENEIFGIQKNISGKVKSRMEKSQREYYLYEQLKEINKELGKDGVDDEFAELDRIILERNPSEEVLLKARKEIKRLQKLQPFSPEAGVLRGYLEWIGDLPWSESTPDSGDLKEAERILNEDHFNMKKAKERILEFIAVRQLGLQGEENTRIKGPILCFVGPPGTGKTSLGKSVARALGRNFVRVSLGGVRDEAEIRGHRKTYVGALPGKIIQSLRKAASVNPVFLLDEIDKLSSDFRGDPASALLEVLDPEQNSTFTDHYMELPYDLSKVLFIATANSLHTIPYPLLDRMEIIEIPGYGEMEKLAIAKQFLVPKELAENSFSEAKIQFKDDALLEIIRHWTMESGVRSLEREIARCIRRIARYAVEKGYGASGDKPLNTFTRTVRRADLEKLLGRRKYKNDVVFKEARVGVSYGLAWTETGGAMLPVETSSFEGSGDLIITGNLGDVMKESARIALSYLRSVQDRYDFKLTDIGKTDFHVHVPEGAIPKDGPSAGITLAASLLSTLCGIAPKPAIAMTGELTLTGRVLPIGGLKEKLLAAIRNGMERVILPADNREDWDELDKDIHASIAVEFVETAEEAFGILFEKGIQKPAETPPAAE